MNEISSFLKKESEQNTEAFLHESSRTVKCALISFRCCIVLLVSLTIFMVGSFFIVKELVKEKEYFSDFALKYWNSTAAFSPTVTQCECTFLLPEHLLLNRSANLDLEGGQ